MTARAAANGRRAHHKCSVEGWPWRMDFSRALAALMASSGSATSINYLACVMYYFRFLRCESCKMLPQCERGSAPNKWGFGKTGFPYVILIVDESESRRGDDGYPSARLYSR